MPIAKPHWSRDPRERAKDAAILEQFGLSFEQNNSRFCRLKGLNISRTPEKEVSIIADNEKIKIDKDKGSLRPKSLGDGKHEKGIIKPQGGENQRLEETPEQLELFEEAPPE